MLYASSIALLAFGAALPATAVQETMAGAPEALAATDRLLEQLGGREVWARARSLHIRERVYHPRYGGPIQVDIWRDLERPAYHSRIIGPGFERVMAWDGRTGWRVRDGRMTPMSGEEVTTEVSGWRQEPYRVYRQLARRDPDLRVALADSTRLVVLDRDGRTLCWFLLDAKGAPLKWGNVFDGRINEHTYGPLVSFGSFRMPAWGTSADASWRFEYVEVTATDDALRVPPPPSARSTK